MAGRPEVCRRRLLLVGGGHAHLHVLRMLGRAPVGGVRVTLISPDAYSTYSGMVPGTLAGLYSLAEAQIDLRALCAQARARFIADHATRIEADARRVSCSAGTTFTYDLLSVDVGSVPAGAEHPDVVRFAVPLKPLRVAIECMEAFARAAREPGGPAAVAVVGAGAGGVEVAFAVAARLRDAQGRQVIVVDRGQRPLAGYSEGVVERVLRLFVRNDIQYVGGGDVVRVDDGGLQLRDGRSIAAGLILWATGAAASPLVRDADLATDDRGFLLVDDNLRSVSHPEVFAAGDCATLRAHPDLPKAGVYAVREGPILWRNLCTALRGEGDLVRYRPQHRFLSLLGTGDGHAVLSYDGLALDGRWVWRLKDWIDRRWVNKHASPPRDRARPPGCRGSGRRGDAVDGGMRPCGGCAAKVSTEVLGRVLDRLDVPTDRRVVVGLDRADDAAVVTHEPDTDVAVSVDAFPAFLDDPFLVGEIAAVNAASDLYAMGGEPRAAAALVTLPRSDEHDEEETLELVLRGALRGLGAMGIVLVGGHTVEAEGLLVGFSMTGSVARDDIMTKGGARPGDAIILTKSLGTGVILAAVRAGEAPSTWAEAAIASMRRPNREAARVLKAARVKVCTDVTGFGLAGHLNEVLVASGVAARIDLGSVPALPGAIPLLVAGWQSSGHGQNERASRPSVCFMNRAQVPRGEQAARALLFDPQTSGGLLAAVPASAVAEVERALVRAGEACHVIGEVMTGVAGRIEVSRGPAVAPPAE